MNAEELIRSCSFISAIRPEADNEKIHAIVDRLTLEYKADVRLIRFFQIGISSSLVRNKTAAGESVRYMLPDSVMAYIEQRKLYRR